jgi:hypothetical protein
LYVFSIHDILTHSTRTFPVFKISWCTTDKKLDVGILTTQNTLTCVGGRVTVTKITGSSLDDWIYFKNKWQHRAKQDFTDITTLYEPWTNLQSLI